MICPIEEGFIEINGKPSVLPLIYGLLSSISSCIFWFLRFTVDFSTIRGVRSHCIFESPTLRLPAKCISDFQSLQAARNRRTIDRFRSEQLPYSPTPSTKPLGTLAASAPVLLFPSLLVFYLILLLNSCYLTRRTESAKRVGFPPSLRPLSPRHGFLLHRPGRIQGVTITLGYKFGEIDTNVQKSESLRRV